jgi:Fe2+ or Zn2+ uptake regulation protein
MSAGRPLNGGELLAALGRDAMDPASIYRALHVFCERGIVHKIEGTDRTNRFALNTRGHDHPHFSCRSCGRMDCLEGTAVTHHDIHADGYIVEEESVVLSGLCARCNKTV